MQNYVIGVAEGFQKEWDSWAEEIENRRKQSVFGVPEVSCA